MPKKIQMSKQNLRFTFQGDSLLHTFKRFKDLTNIFIRIIYIYIYIYIIENK